MTAMKSSRRLIVVVMLLLLASAAGNRAYAVQPEYAKWGRIAMEQTKSRYSGAIVDYLHVGRTQVSEGIAEEKFKLWLREDKREYGVWVTIRFYTANDQIITIKFQRTDR